HYYVTMNIGNPAKPYFLDVDTGSDLTWLQCDAPCRSCNKVPHPLYRPTANRLVPCANALCTALHSGQGSNNKCPSPKQCDYQIKYTDSASSQGVLINDSFSLPMRSSNIRPGLTFGCGYDQQVGKNGAVQAAIDGMLGLGRGSVSLVSQLKQQGITKNVVGHCLSTNGGGFLFFGDDVVPSSRVTWVPMAQRTSGNYYSPGSGTLYFDRRSLGVKPMEVVFDSGSTYTYFTAQPYQAVVSAFEQHLKMEIFNVIGGTEERENVPVYVEMETFSFKLKFNILKEYIINHYGINLKEPLLKSRRSISVYIVLIINHHLSLYTSLMGHSLFSLQTTKGWNMNMSGDCLNWKMNSYFYFFIGPFSVCFESIVPIKLKYTELAFEDFFSISCLSPTATAGDEYNVNKKYNFIIIVKMHMFKYMQLLMAFDYWHIMMVKVDFTYKLNLVILLNLSFQLFFDALP
ncbi:hypothetical protein ACJX0J_012882, partial [Zea mays]